MAHDGFLGGFHELVWPFANAAATGAAPFDALQVHVQHALMGAGEGWEHDFAVGALVLSQSTSPLAVAAPEGAAVESALMEQLESSLCNSVPSPPPSRYASCHSTPVGSPSSKPPVLSAEPTARFPCVAASGVRAVLRVASSLSLLGEQAPAPPPAPAPSAAPKQASDGPSRMPKALGGKSKAKDAVTTAPPKPVQSRDLETRAKAKKSKLSTEAADDEEQKPAAGDARHGDDGKGKEVAEEAPKDYIHVRARRGQATDSHSLAERVRREKISDRMKLLQDLVPGCSKVTGKAVMLDEIINYVRSLQRQVEFLSMKLSTVNPRLALDVESFIRKDANQPCAPATSSLPPVYSLEGSSSGFCYGSSQASFSQSVVMHANGFKAPPSLLNHGIPDHSIEGFRNANHPQTGSLWEEDDLQSLVLMGFRGNT